VAGTFGTFLVAKVAIFLYNMATKKVPKPFFIENFHFFI